jgi:hypothetical protein
VVKEGRDARLMSKFTIAVIRLGWWGEVIVPWLIEQKLRVVAVSIRIPRREFARQQDLPL